MLRRKPKTKDSSIACFNTIFLHLLEPEGFAKAPNQAHVRVLEHGSPGIHPHHDALAVIGLIPYQLERLERLELAGVRGVGVENKFVIVKLNQRAQGNQKTNVSDQSNGV